MIRSDGLIAVGLGTCISRQGFSPDTVTKVGDKCIIYTNRDSGEYWRRAEMGVSGPELCTWGQLGVHYTLSYEFSDEHKARHEVIQPAKEMYCER